MAQAPQAKQPQIQYDYVDRPEISETFADFVQRIQFDGQTLRIEFCVGRHQETKDGKTTGTRYPTCRLVMTIQCGVDLVNRLQQVVAALTKAGVLKQQPAGTPAI